MLLECIMKSRAITIIVIFVMLLSVPSIHAKEDGITNKSVDGCSCHGGGEGNAEVTLNLPEQYSSGQSYALTINVGGTGFSAGGFNLAVTQGTLSTTDSNTKIVSGQAVHSNSNSNNWEVVWMAPPQGSGLVTFTLAGLSADGNGQTSNDGWSTLSLDIPEGNLAPIISNVQILPVNPTSSDSLQLIYDYEDNEDDPDSSTIIWYKNGDLDSQGAVASAENLLGIDYSKTERGDIWSAEITPNDGVNSGVIIIEEVVILNSKPVVDNLSITPSGPSQNDDLKAGWDEYDEDGDALSSSIKWFKNDTHQTELDGLTTVSSSSTQENEEWFFSITLNDTIEEQITNSSKVILNLVNDIPTIENMKIQNIEPTTRSDLTAEWLFLDGDGDDQSSYEIRWYLDGMFQSQLNNQITVDSQFTSKGEIWNFEIRASDELEFSDWYQSPSLEINNSIPEVIGFITPINPTNGTNLILNFSTIDVDNDVLNINVEWIRNNSIFLTNYSDVTPYELRSNDTLIGESWFANIIVNDGESSFVFTTEPVTIFPEPISIEDIEDIEDFTTIAYLQSITYGIFTMVTFMLVQFLLSVKASRGSK